MNPVLDGGLTLLIPSLVLLHLYIAPFTKVEESFNIQATRDILVNGIPFRNASAALPEQFDHVEFPGAVPRTFVGAAVLAGLSKPWMSWVIDGMQMQLIARGILGLFNSFALVSYRSAVTAAYGEGAGMWYLIFQASQFHIIYYASRTLPNMFAFGIVTLAMKYFVTSLLPRKPARDFRICLFLLTSSAVLFRAELFLLLYGVIGTRLLNSARPDTSQTSLSAHLLAVLRTMAPGVLAGLSISLPLTLGLDTLLWPPHKVSPWPLWPEAYGFVYNAVYGNASEWGTSPWHFYITSAIPRLLLNPFATMLIFLPLTSPLPVPKESGNMAASTKPVSATIILPHMLFVGLYSWLAHKEWRFVVYVVPPLTGVASAGAHAIWTLPKSGLARTLNRGALALSVAASMLLATSGLLLSSLNYPGGTGLMRLKGYIDSGAAFNPAHGHSASSPGTSNMRSRTWSVYADNLACQTGVTRFLADDYTPVYRPGGLARHGLSIVKTDAPEDYTPDTWASFDFALVEHPERVVGSWEVLDIVWAFNGVKLIKPSVGGDEDEDEFEELGDDPLSLDRPKSSIDVNAVLKARSSGSRARQEMGLVLEERQVDQIIGYAVETIADLWSSAEDILKDRLLKGYWIKGQMTPKVWILRREGIAHG